MCVGGNTAYGDVHNLGWKLAAAVRGWGGDVLLDSYSNERRQAAFKTALYNLSSCCGRPKSMPSWSCGSRLLAPVALNFIYTL